MGAGTATAIRFYQPTNSWYQINADTVYGANVQAFLAVPSSANLRAAVTDETGTGSLVFATSPTLVAPALGTPTALVGTNITGIAAGLTAGNVTTNANLTGAITSVGNATSLGSFTSANLAAALTDETGSGALVFATGPTFNNINGSIQSLSGPGAVNLTTYTTAFTSTGTGDALTLANGAAGQIKNIVYVAEAAGADTGVLTPSNFGNGTTITFTNVGDSCQIQFIGTDWWVISLNGATIA